MASALTRMLRMLEEEKFGRSSGGSMGGGGINPASAFKGGPDSGRRNVSPIKMGPTMHQAGAPHTLAAMLAADGQDIDAENYDRNVTGDLAAFQRKFAHSQGGWQGAYNRRRQRVARGIRLGDDTSPETVAELNDLGLLPGSRRRRGRRALSQAILSE